MMEQYSDTMSQELHDYSLWEHDYWEMAMLPQGFSDSKEAAASEYAFYAKDVSNDNNNHRNDGARNETTGKPKRRRLKGAAAAQSTTFLKASISNFRALVQQHTGCHNATKGPITLCFAAPAAAAQPSPHYYYSGMIPPFFQI